MSTDVHERNQLALSLEDSRYVIEDDEKYVIPLETTALSKGFTEAWRIGADLRELVVAGPPPARGRGRGAGALRAGRLCGHLCRAGD